MTYSISLSGHGVDPDDLKEVFEDTVRALRAISHDGSSPGGQVYNNDGIEFRMNASDVTALDAADASPVDNDEDGDNEPDEAPETAEPSLEGIDREIGS